MAPSRGLRLLTKKVPKVPGRAYSSFTNSVSNPKNRIQSYISQSRDPYLNLSIEHYILQHSSPECTVLFIYTNRPCIVIGRNQNPWVEVNLGLLGTGKGADPSVPGAQIDLVRRRSGGGTVFQDEGNVNWSVISPPADFTRDKHAEMVVRALRRQGIDRVRVNERHDIVLDRGTERIANPAMEDMHRTPYTMDDPNAPRPWKVSGSAYKLTRTRALHHGTCLLTSPNLSVIPKFLRSPAKPYIRARGVESVSSPVGNIGMQPRKFEQSVQEEFARDYDLSNTACIVVGDHQLEVPEIRKGYDELKSLDWMYCQTPQFTLYTEPQTDSVQSAGFPPPPKASISITSKHGAISDISVDGSVSTEISQELNQIPKAKIHELRQSLQSYDAIKKDGSLISWLLRMLPTPQVKLTR